VKNPFDRYPLLVPQLFADGNPWYRRRATIAKLAVAIVFVILVIAFVPLYTVETVIRTLARLGHAD
jgi:hypothetical protein